MKNCLKTDDKGLTISICPHTGLTTYTRPEWTDVIFGEDYSLSITIIGDRILAVRIKGFSTHDVVAESTDFTKQVIHDFWGNQKELFYIGDFTGITGITNDARQYYVGYLKSLKQIKAFILCSPSPFMTLAGNLSKRFNITKFAVTAKKDYPAAVKEAVRLLHLDKAKSQECESSLAPHPLSGRKKPVLPGKSPVKRRSPSAFTFLGRNKKRPVSLPRITRKEWFLEMDGYSATFELINGNIIHKISKGNLGVEHIRPVYEIQEKIFKACGLEGQPYYLVNGSEGLQGSSLKARKKYVRLFSQWVDKYPGLHQAVVYGANRQLRAGLNIALYKRPVSVVFADDVDGALALLQKNQKKKRPLLSRLFVKKTGRSATVTHYADELSSFLSNINWEEEGGNDRFAEKNDDHPFKTVYDAIELIKADIDELFRDREKAQLAVKESEEVSRALLNATRDLALLVQTDGTIIAVNKPFAAFIGQEQNALKGKQLADYFPQSTFTMALAHVKDVVETGEPALFETEMASRHYENTFYPVYNVEGIIDRLALYSRDITGLKQAQEQIHGLTQELIKAQENERRRIARDLHDNVAQDLASLIISNDAIFEGWKEVPPEVRERNNSFSRVLKKSIASIRDLVYDLRPPGLNQIGLVKTIDQYCQDFSRKTGLEVDLFTAGIERLHLDTNTNINLYRILQEALNNTYKHAQAQLVTVRLIASHPDLILRIEDDGCGFDPEVRMVDALREKRMGLKSMEERVNLLAGGLTIRSRKGAGTRIVVTCPFRQDTTGNEAEPI